MVGQIMGINHHALFKIIHVAKVTNEPGIVYASIACVVQCHHGLLRLLLLLVKRIRIEIAASRQ